MKTFTFLIAILLLTHFSFAQKHKFSYVQWSDSSTYRISPKPLVTGHTALSDSMASLMNAKEVYEHNGTFYFINSWAEYYLWYVAKYPDKFRSPKTYKRHYETKNNYAMVKFVKNNFKENRYPAQIVVSLDKKQVENDRYFNQWEKKIMAIDERKNKQMKKSNEEERQKYNNSTQSKATDSTKK